MSGNEMPTATHCTTPVGSFTIICRSGCVTGLYAGIDTSSAAEVNTELSDRAREQLNEYFQGRRRRFDLPLELSGTPFQKRVLEALMTIPYGETRSYKEIAEQIGSPRAYRAVGMAANRNPLMIFVPCHRMIGADGSLTGFGAGLGMKRQLLELERGRSRVE